MNENVLQTLSEILYHGLSDFLYKDNFHRRMLENFFSHWKASKQGPCRGWWNKNWTFLSRSPVIKKQVQMLL